MRVILQSIPRLLSSSWRGLSVCRVDTRVDAFRPASHHADSAGWDGDVMPSRLFGPLRKASRRVSTRQTRVSAPRVWLTYVPRHQEVRDYSRPNCSGRHACRHECLRHGLFLALVLGFTAPKAMP